MIKENQKYLNRFLILSDAVVMILSLIFAWYIRFKSGLIYSEGYLLFRQYLKPAICIVPVYLLLYEVFNLYVPYRFKSMYQEFVNIIKAEVLGLLIFIMILFLFKQIDYSRGLLFIFTSISISLTTLERCILRAFLRRLRKRGFNLKHIILVGYSEVAIEFLNRVKKNKHWGYEVLGILDDRFQDSIFEENTKNEVFEEIAASNCGVKIIGKVEDLEKYLTEADIDEVFITLGIKEYDKMSKVISVCEKSGIRTQIVPGYYKYMPARPYVEEVDGLPIINLRYIPLDNLFNKLVKRLFDIVISFIAISLLLPLVCIIALIIKLTSPGPVIFKQERVGLNKKPFNMYKFRSMHVQKESEEKVQWTTANDPRKTKFGSFIRKTSIDELPQLFNVLKGDMSLVGPRPERPFFVDKFKEEIPKYMVKHQVRPGITGWAQVNGWRGDTSIEKRIECDIYYIENWNFGMDIKIMFLTVFKGFVNKNAY